ncbi:ATP-dependent DNA helicase DDX11 [Chrysoperla carnea]|uniref:ATP-dependent DNA helicase DDX11 n=1 Tax=Chrysoperla carnea TaxID=189513 RepID=UPI001D07319C|nr:ATP-dependent DNA helicase DDX11 [Chrysoperla carnea]
MSSVKEFDFPFPPYDIQKQFMNSLYNALETNKLGIFESPTGTGKTMSLICGSLTWLRDHELRKQQELIDKIKEINQNKNKLDSEDDWISSQSEAILKSKERDKLQLELDKINKYEEKIENIKKNVNVKKEKKHWSKKQTENILKMEEIVEDDLDLILEDNVLRSNDENSPPVSDCDENEDEYAPTKIIFCSRTHSQLAQYVGEVLKSPFGKTTRVVTLASRQTYCINEAVKKLKSLSIINERCLDLQQKKKEKTSKSKDGKSLKRQKIASGCPYMNENNIEQLKEEAIVEIHDVENLVAIGKELSACPYYGARATVLDSQIVVIPYNILLHKSTRKASGIQLKNNVVIIDEAHNLLDTIGHIHSCVLSGQHLTHAHSQLIQYKEKYLNRFSAKNLLRLNQIIFIIERLIKLLGGKPGIVPEQENSKSESQMYTLQDFVFAADIDSINIFKLLEFCETSKISHKLHGFSEKYQPTVVIHPKVETKTNSVSNFLKKLVKNEVDETVTNNETEKEFIMNNPILIVIAFLECLTNACDDGRVYCYKHDTLSKAYFKFLLLNPASRFMDIVKEAKSVIIAGGTMQPFSEFTDQLFIAAGANPSRILEFSCGHVIPPTSILPIIACSGPTGKSFDFSFEFRNNLETLDELGRLLTNVTNIVPGGVICFFPSYDYEKLVYNHFEKNGFITKISRKKTLFREPKLSSDVDSVLDKFSSTIKRSGSTGALLFSVVGGKLSEGLNFSDDLGRCVIVIGLPYPNIKSPELQEKMTYLDKNVNPAAGKVHYENLCMKAVNQCIGRAIRHRNDYAAVLLLDHRYSRPTVQKALPGWIQRSLIVQSSFGPVMGSLSKFFNSKKQKEILAK